jgi:hypothetical protein
MQYGTHEGLSRPRAWNRKEEFSRLILNEAVLLASTATKKSRSPPIMWNSIKFTRLNLFTNAYWKTARVDDQNQRSHPFRTLTLQ